MKKFGALLLSAALLAGTLVACGGGTPTGSNNNAASSGGGTPAAQTKISFINSFTGGDGPFMKAIVDGFNGSQDKYFIEELQSDDHYVKFKSDDFDMLIIHSDLIATYQDDGLLRALDDIYEKSGISLENDFHEVSKSYASVDGTPYVFPLDCYMMTMFYNKELVETPPATYQDMLDLRDKLDFEKTGVYVTGDHQRFWTMMVEQSGATYVEGQHLKLDTDEVADALLGLNKMIYEDKLSPTNLGANDHINSFIKEGSDNTIRTATAMMGPWNYSAVKEVLGDNLGIAPLPLVGKELKIPGGGHNFAVSAKITDEAKLDGITEFFKYAYTPEVMLNWADSGQAPVHLATIEEINKNAEKYPVATVNYTVMDAAVIPPSIYNIREQVKDVNTEVYNMLQSTPNLTKEQLMPVLEKVTKKAQELSELK